MKANRPSRQKRNHDTCKNGQERTGNDREQALPHQTPIAAPDSKPYCEDLREKWKKQGCHDDSNRVVLNNAIRQEERAAERPAYVAGRDVAQLPKIFDNVRRRLNHWPGEVRNRLTADDRPQLARCDRALAGIIYWRSQERIKKRLGLGRRCFNADDMLSLASAMHEDFVHGRRTDPDAQSDARHISAALDWNRCPDLMHTEAATTFLSVTRL